MVRVVFRSNKKTPVDTLYMGFFTNFAGVIPYW